MLTTRIIVFFLVATAILACGARAATAAPGGCVAGSFGTAVLCGGQYVDAQPGLQVQIKIPPAIAPKPSSPPVPMAPYIANGPNGPCVAVGPANPAPNATVQAWLTTNRDPACPAPPGAPAPPPIDPNTLAVQFWQTIPLPHPDPSVPPGYGITGRTAYLVTHGTLEPPPFTEGTPLGTLMVQAIGTYTVNWGDTHAPGVDGPYDYEGTAWPDGRITHTYDWVGTYRIVVTENWTATWQLAGASGELGGLTTTGTVPDFRVEQLQAVVVS